MYDLRDDNCKIEYGYDQPEQAEQSAEEDMQQSWALLSRALERLSGQDGSGNQIGEGCGKEKGVGEIAERDEDNPEDQVDLLDAEAFLGENNVDEMESGGTMLVTGSQHGL